ncbi:hydantoinase/oxoprolinase family protein [Sphingomonas rubra]|uniref:Hydantoinase/oxoprolinase n=1 Tax=Sphingomonas rubra TaxID=634430 RepID=A0A1I5THN1_9SPHN|nr:hydantoinase/oxoprolinase family protein [Sphingomonas rubra]SFP82574.1 Hydantoinase/oxoprolinase [Sphingomonas rubra]
MATSALRPSPIRRIAIGRGGPFTDVSRWAARFERRREAVIVGVRVSAPMLRIDTVAAGGGYGHPHPSAPGGASSLSHREREEPAEPAKGGGDRSWEDPR